MTSLDLNGNNILTWGFFFFINICRVSIVIYGVMIHLNTVALKKNGDLNTFNVISRDSRNI